MYKTGDIIVKSEPWVFSVLEKTADTLCYRCFQKPPPALGKVRRCSRCLFSHYCSEECQKADWSDRHQQECKVIRQLRLDESVSSQWPIDCLLLIFKVITKLQRGENGDRAGNCTPSSDRKFEDLMSHEEDFAQNPAVSMLYTLWKPYIGALDKTHLICPDINAFFRLYGKVNTNGFSIADYYLGETGRALYLGPSVFDHSCDPNAIQFFIGKTLVVKAIRDIGTFAQVRIAYDSSFNTKYVRQSYLRRHFYFTCTCPHCVDPKLEAVRHAIKCISSGCDQPIPLDSRAQQPCPKCGADNSTQLDLAVPVVKNILSEQERFHDTEHLPAAKKLASLHKSLDHAEALLHPTNFLLGLLYRDLFAVLDSMDQKYSGIPYLQKALLPIENHLNKYESSATGSISEIVHFLMNTRKFEEALVYASDLRERLMVVPGCDSAVYKEYDGLFRDCELAVMARMKTRKNKS